MHNRNNTINITTKVQLLVASTFLFAISSCTARADKKEVSVKQSLEIRKELSEALTDTVRNNKFSNKLKFNFNSATEDYEIQYSFDESMQDKARKLLKSYKPDYGAIVMIDADTGRILAMASQERHNSAAENLNLRATFPAASIFKVVTATAAIDHAGVQPLHRIGYNGANYTLYKKNVLSDKVNKWTRFITLKDAFARSINTAFGRLALENLGPEIIADYAHRFKFNSELNTDFEVQRSSVTIPDEKGYELTQVAAGYNRINTLSPVHGAMIASAIVNGGKIVSPYLVESVKNESGQIIYTSTPLKTDGVMSEKSSLKLQELMEQTVLTGTSRKTFRSLVKNKKYKEVEMGGKTGHFTGTNPRGTTDWFIGYADDGERKIAIATLTVNVKKWTVKSSNLAQMMFKEYFKPDLGEKRIASASTERKKFNN